MGKLIPQVIVAGLAASVSPVAIMLLISVMLQKHARRNSLLFLAGFTLVLITIGVLGVALFHTTPTGKTSHVDYWIDIALGVLCLAAIPLSLRPRKKTAKRAEAADMSAAKAFVIGAIAMLINSSTIVIYIAGAHLISAAKVSTSDTVLALVIMTFMTLLTLIVPIALYFLLPEKSEKILNGLKGWLIRHNKVIGVGLLLVIGGYLLGKGIVGLL
jgi:threonine/homoserine/homoserine lactone efflux protein